MRITHRGDAHGDGGLDLPPSEQSNRAPRHQCVARADQAEHARGERRKVPTAPSPVS